MLPLLLLKIVVAAVSNAAVAADRDFYLFGGAEMQNALSNSKTRARSTCVFIFLASF